MSDQRLSFVQREFTGKTYTWQVWRPGVTLGLVKWYAPWRRYCFMPSSATIFDASCLTEVIEFIRYQMDRRKTAIGSPLRAHICIPSEKVISS